MTQGTMLIIAAVLALAATVLAFIFIVPEKKRPQLGAFGKFLHDTCNFKHLMVEKILQALYIFTTAATILFGVLMLFRTEYNYWTGERVWMGGIGLLIIILGPIVIRLSYELMMMAILLLKNVIAINRKLPDKLGSAGGDVFAVPDIQELRQRREAAPSAQETAPRHAYCRVCGTELVNGVCPKCPPQYCKLCGTQLVNGICPKCSAPTDSTPPQA